MGVDHWICISTGHKDIFTLKCQSFLFISSLLLFYLGPSYPAVLITLYTRSESGLIHFFVILPRIFLDEISISYYSPIDVDQIVMAFERRNTRSICQSYYYLFQAERL